MGRIKGRKVLIRDVSMRSLKQVRKVAARLPTLSDEEYSVVSDKSLPPDVAPIPDIKPIQVDRKKWSDLHRMSQYNVTKTNQNNKRVNVGQVLMKKSAANRLKNLLDDSNQKHPSNQNIPQQTNIFG